MDKIEKYILDNKEEFDESRHPEKGWKELEHKMDPKKKDWSTVWKVAAVVFFISTSGLMISKFSKSERPQAVSVSSTDSIEGFFVRVINNKREEYLALADESDREELFQDLEELDSGYANLKRSYEQLESEELLQAMLENLQLRVYILTEQIEILRYGNSNDEEVYHSS